jgi:LPXTG-motif cell wall-anchored protein
MPGSMGNSSSPLPTNIATYRHRYRYRAEISTGPPSLGGEAQNIAVTVLDPEFVRLLTVTYGLTCNPPTGPSSAVDYMLLLYVGIPIPADELAATGPSMGELSLAAGGLALGGIVLLFADRRRRRHAH